MAIGTKKIENYIPVVKYNEGLYTELDLTVATGAVVTLPSTTTIGGSAVVALGDITSSATTGNMFTVTNTGVYTGTGVVSLVANSATTGVIQLITANGLTTGVGLRVTSSGVIATTGRLLSLVGSGLTTGTALDFGALQALTTGTGILMEHTTSVIADGGSLVRLSSSSIDTGGATNGTILDIKSTAQLAGTVVRVDNILTTGTAISVIGTGTMTTTGNLLTLTANSATTAAGLFRINGNGLTSGIGAVITSSATAITGAGRLLRVDHTGATSTSGILSEFASAANDETVIFQVTSSAALAAGKAVNISGASVTTGTLLSVANADALTTGMVAQFKSNSADATARTLVDIHNDHASAVGTIPLKITQDAPTSTNFKLMMTLGTMQVFVSDQTSPNTALTATEGSICFNGSSTGQMFWNTDGSTAWTAFA